MSTNLAYVAGLIDGEGCVHLDTARRGQSYRARVSVGMSGPALPLLTSLRDEWGGTLYLLRPETDRWASAHTWHLTGEKARTLLLGVRPYLRLKHQQADLALQVESIRDGLPKRPNGQASWTDAARTECAAIKAQIHRLNAKGPRASAPTVGDA